MHQPHSAIAVANEFLHIACENGDRLDQMKLQKLAFYAHGWSLGLRHTPLLDEEVEAWKYGPVIPSIYHALKKYGTLPITELESSIDTYGRVYVPRLPDGYDRSLPQKIWAEYGQYSAVQLSKMTHRIGTPWFTTWMGNEYRLRSLAIPNKLIEQYFEHQAAKNRGNVVEP